MKEVKLSEILLHARVKKEMTLRALAEATGLTHGAIFQYERSHSYPSPETLKILCKSLNINFKTALTTLKQEKLELKQKRLLGTTSPKYPEIRKFLLLFYSEELYKIDEKDNRWASENETKNELEKFPLHPIEEKLLNEIYRRLNIGDKPKDSSNPIEFFARLKKKDLKNQLIKARVDWSAKKNFDSIYVTFESKKGCTQTIKYQFWKEQELKKEDILSINASSK